MSDQETIPQNIGVINPYALAEVVLRRKIDWSQVNPSQVLAQTLGRPYEELFDPKYESPLYTGLKLNRESLTMERAPLSQEATFVPTDTSPRVDSSIPETDAGAGITDADRAPEETPQPQSLADIQSQAVWLDPGIFLYEAAELTDPVQGAVGDCYFVAALCSVAWALPYQIAHRARAFGVNQQQFVDMIEFHQSGKPVRVEVTELLPLNPPANSFIYARSSESGEIWPAVYEKAYAKWRTGHSGDTPNILLIAGGDPVGAAAQITGLTPHYYSTKHYSAHDLWQKVRGNCLSMKTFNPVVAWTYSSGDAAPDNINYNNAHLAANHAYSILGWTYNQGREYIVLRNPWGTYEATLNVFGGTWVAWDAPYYGGPGWWRPTPMATVDGIFALRADTFKMYFAGLGWVV